MSMAEEENFESRPKFKVNPPGDMRVDIGEDDEGVEEDPLGSEDDISDEDAR